MTATDHLNQLCQLEQRMAILIKSVKVIQHEKEGVIADSIALTQPERDKMRNAATKFCCRDKDFHKNSSLHTKRFVAATCHRDMWVQLVAQCVPTLTREQKPYLVFVGVDKTQNVEHPGTFRNMKKLKYFFMKNNQLIK